MNVGTGGEQAVMRPTVWNGSIQANGAQRWPDNRSSVEDNPPSVKDDPPSVGSNFVVGGACAFYKYHLSSATAKLTSTFDT